MDSARQILQNTLPQADDASGLKDRVVQGETLAAIDLLQSRHFLDHGHLDKAHLFARMSVKGYQQTWSILCNRQKRAERQLQTPTESSNNIITEELTDSTMSEKCVQCPISDQRMRQSPALWSLSMHVFGSLVYLAKLFMDLGLFADTDFYLSEAGKMVDKLGSPQAACKLNILRAYHFSYRGDTPATDHAIAAASEYLSCNFKDHGLLGLDLELAGIYIRVGKFDAAKHLLQSTGDRIVLYRKDPTLNANDEAQEANSRLVDTFSELSIQESRHTSRSKATTKHTPGRRVVKGRRKDSEKSTKHNTNTDEAETPSILSKQLREMHYLTAKLQAACGDSAYAQQLLDASSESLDRPSDLRHTALESETRMAVATQQIARHPLFNVIPDSAICYPPVERPRQGGSTVNSNAKYSQGRKQEAGKPSINSKSGSQIPFVQSLRMVQDKLTAILPETLRRFSNQEIRHITDALNITSMTLTAFAPYCSGPQTPSLALALTAG